MLTLPGVSGIAGITVVAELINTARITMAMQSASASEAVQVTAIGSVTAALAQTQQSIQNLQASLLQGLRSEMMIRIGALPLELAKDGVAYETLKSRLEKDLAEVFQARESSPP